MRVARVRTVEHVKTSSRITTVHVFLATLDTTARLVRIFNTVGRCLNAHWFPNVLTQMIVIEYIVTVFV